MRYAVSVVGDAGVIIQIPSELFEATLESAVKNNCEAFTVVVNVDGEPITILNAITSKEAKD